MKMMNIWGWGEWESEMMGGVSSMVFWWWLNLRATLIALLILLIFHLSNKFYSKFLQTSTSTSTSSSSTSSSSSSTLHLPSPCSPISPSDSQSRIPEIVSESDLKFLIDNLDGKLNEDEKWENVIDKENNFLSYKAKCCRPKDRPLKYLSMTVFESCSPELLRDFYMDNDYRKQWDKTLLDHIQLQMDITNGIEIGRTIKKFPLLTPREYILAWRLWEGKDRTFYCFIKSSTLFGLNLIRGIYAYFMLPYYDFQTGTWSMAMMVQPPSLKGGAPGGAGVLNPAPANSQECDHPSAPRQKKYVRVGYFRSGWQIRKVPGRDASEIRMFHQEDAGLNVEMAKLAFAKGIWSYVCKMDNALRKFSVIRHPLTSSAVSAVTLIQKVPPELDTTGGITSPADCASMAIPEPVNSESREKKLSRRPSKKFVAKSLLLLGGVICLSRGHSALGAKVAMAYILTKLRKRGDSSSQSSLS